MNTLLIFLKVGPLVQILNQSINQYLRGTGTWAKLSEEIWLIRTTASAIRVRDDLRGILIRNVGSGITDQVVVFDISKSEWASLNLPSEILNWIKANI